MSSSLPRVAVILLVAVYAVGAVAYFLGYMTQEEATDAAIKVALVAGVLVGAGFVMGFASKRGKPDETRVP